MKIKDCKVGLKVKPVKKFGEIQKDGLKIHSINKEKNKISIKNGCFISSGHNPEHFEPIDKFEIGEEVIYNDFFKKRKAQIFGVADGYDRGFNKYAITIYGDNGIQIHGLVNENQLSKLKKKNELKKGDKFIEKHFKSKYKVLDKKYDEQMERVKYFAERLKDGSVAVLSEESINEIIYEGDDE